MSDYVRAESFILDPVADMTELAVMIGVGGRIAVLCSKCHRPLWADQEIIDYVRNSSTRVVVLDEACFRAGAVRVEGVALFGPKQSPRDLLTAQRIMREVNSEWN